MEDRRLLAVIDLAALTASEGVVAYGAEFGEFSGWSVNDAGDVNGDGFDDLIIGAYYADGEKQKKFRGFGSDSLPEAIDLAALGTPIGVPGTTLNGATMFIRSGFSVTGAGDLNGDCFDDLIIGTDRTPSWGNSRTAAGESYVILGRDAMPTTIDLSTLGSPAGHPGLTVFGAEFGDRIGKSVSGGGDVDGDGFDDLIIGAYRADAAGNLKSRAGESYIIFGGDFTASISHQGTDLNDLLTGTAAADVISAVWVMIHWSAAEAAMC